MTLSKILREKLLIQNSHSNGHLTSFDALITAYVTRPNRRIFCWLCSSGNELKNFSRVQRRKYDTIVNIDVSLFDLLIGKSPDPQNKHLYERQARTYPISCEMKTPYVGEDGIF